MSSAVSLTSFRLRFWSAALGNLFEHYDTALFGFLSPFLAPLMFPQQEPLTALILTYAMIPLGMLARPLGSLVFGYVGDRYGRRVALSWTLGGMGIVSACIALMPTYSQVGVFAPLLMCIGRAMQNFLAAGETMGGAIFLLENAPEKKHDLLSSFYNASTIGGILLASAAVSVLSYCGAVEKGWRFLYLLGCVTALFGAVIRRQIDEPASTSSSWQPYSFLRLWRVFWQWRQSLVLIAISSGFGYASYAMALVLMNGFIPLVSTFTKAEMMGLNTALLILDFCALPFFGWLSCSISRDKLMRGAALIVAITALPLSWMLGGASFATIVGIRIFFVLLGVAFFAPFHAWAAQLVPTTSRYAIVSLGYALGSQLLGGPTAAISLWLFKVTKTPASICWYWAALALLTSYALMRAARVKKLLYAIK